MFLREVQPKYIHEDFLNCFLMLPQSFFSPKAPEKFQNFIQQYGTHYTKAAKFGGQLKIIKTQEITDESEIKDFRDEMQGQVNEIVGNVGAQQKQAQAAKSAGYQVGGSAGVAGISGSASGAKSKSQELGDSQECLLLEHKQNDKFQNGFSVFKIKKNFGKPNLRHKLLLPVVLLLNLIRLQAET